MKPYLASLINGLFLLIFGLWSSMPYLLNGEGSPTALIPVILGACLLMMNKGVKKENKFISHLAVLTTLITILGLSMPLKGEIEREDFLGVFRVSMMMISSIFAMIIFIISFIDARKNKI